VLTNIHRLVGCRAPVAAAAVLILTLPVSAGVAQGTGQQQPPPPAQEPPKPPPPAPPPPKPLVANSPDGTKIVYEVTGSGPAVMLLHGGGQTRRSWHDAGYVDRLSKTFTVITVDLRGSGESDKPETADAYALDRVLADLLAVADAASAKTFHVWGFGHGASIARYLAARSDRVISAVLVGATMGPTVTGLAKDAIVAMRSKWQALLDDKRAGKLDPKSVSAGDRAALENGMAVSAIALGALVDYPPLEPAEIKVPTLWVLASDDATAAANQKLYADKLAGTKVTLKVLPSTTYADIFFKVEQTLEAVGPFLGIKP
jgi:pimeloyl-ACP methyl ester carboxylesterase